MMLDNIIEELPVKSSLAKMIIGSTLVALIIALGMLDILSLLRFSINPVIPTAIAVAGAAVYAASMKR